MKARIHYWPVSRAERYSFPPSTTCSRLAAFVSLMAVYSPSSRLLPDKFR